MVAAPSGCDSQESYSTLPCAWDLDEKLVLIMNKLHALGQLVNIYHTIYFGVNQRV
jgi:hypothetical protein